MELYFFYTLMVVYGAFYGFMTTGKEGEEYSSPSMKYPIAGVFAFFGLMLVTYYLLTMADRGDVGMLNSYLGTLTFVAFYFIARHVCRNRK